jgi:nitric-oxide synthase
MNLDTKTNASLWKDKVLVELNAAIIYSYQVSI